MEKRRLEIGKLTDRGQKRAQNQDAVATGEGMAPAMLARKGMLCLVADGLGKGGGGAVASDLAVRTVAHEFYRDPSPSVRESLLRAIETANLTLIAQAAQNPALAGMGTTLVAAVVRGPELVVAHVGDSRAYLLRRGALRPLTQDHSWVAEEVRAGRLTAEQARGHPQARLLSRSLGTPGVKPDVAQHRLQPGDRLLLCSDGLTDIVPNEEIQQIVQRERPTTAVSQLISATTHRGAPDNVTALALEVAGGAGPSRFPAVPVASVAAAFLLLVLFVASRSGGPPFPTTATAVAIVSATPQSPATTAATGTAEVTPAVTATASPVPSTDTPTPTATRRPVLTASSTPTRGLIYPAPVLSEPGDNAAYEGPEAAIVLTWQPVPGLQADEYYVVTIPYPHDGATWNEVQWVKDPRWRVPRYLFDLLSEPRRCQWYVTVMRQTGTEPDGKRTGIAVSPRSETRSFTWGLASPSPTNSPSPEP